MIKERHVVRMKIPFPSASSELAYSPHMYICMKAVPPQYKFVKCQTLKPYMLISNVIKNYCDEAPDISRNPFKHMTRIDCDKTFCTSGVEYDAGLLTTARPDICKELFAEIQDKLCGENILLDKAELLELNVLIRDIREIS